MERVAVRYFIDSRQAEPSPAARDDATAKRLRETVFEMGLCAGPDDINQGLRGLRTMGVRLAHHQMSGLKVAHWLQSRPEILRVLHPALESHPGHTIWKRDFTGACGLFSVIFKPGCAFKAPAIAGSPTEQTQTRIATTFK